MLFHISNGEFLLEDINEQKNNSQSKESIKQWNNIRELVFQEINEKFIKIALEKGLKEPRRLLIQNNYSYFEDFMKRKIRYLISEMTKDKEISNSIDEIGKKCREEKKEENSSYDLINFLTRIILTNNEYKQQILDYIQEFLTFLIVF